MTTAALVTLLTDFGAGSVYVGQMHGMLALRAPEVRVVDLAHDVPAGGVAAAGYLLERSYAYFPAGSVHVAVVDPGVGSARQALTVRAHGHCFVAPDNGLLGALIATDEGAEVRRVENEALCRARVSHTFHGRDVFAPVGAHLAGGGALADVGPVTKAEGARPGAERTPEGTVEGRVLLVDRFGNLITDIPEALLADLGPPDRLRVHAGTSCIPAISRTFSDVPRGEVLGYVGSGEHLEIAVHAGRASDVLGVDVGARIHVERRSS